MHPLTPRLRSLESRTAEEDARLRDFESSWAYQGEQTCAADGMCQEKCPVKINTGELVKSVRAEQVSEWRTASSAAMAVANNFGAFSRAVPAFLNAVDLAHGIVGPRPLQAISRAVNRASDHYVPEWNPFMPKGAAKLRAPPKPAPAPEQARGIPRKVVYAPACVTRMMGPARGDNETESVHEKLMSLFAKAGYEVRRRSVCVKGCSHVRCVFVTRCRLP